MCVYVDVCVVIQCCTIHVRPFSVLFLVHGWTSHVYIMIRFNLSWLLSVFLKQEENDFFFKCMENINMTAKLDFVDLCAC